MMLRRRRCSRAGGGPGGASSSGGARELAGDRDGNGRVVGKLGGRDGGTKDGLPAAAPARPPGLIDPTVPSAWRPIAEREGAVWRSAAVRPAWAQNRRCKSSGGPDEGNLSPRGQGLLREEGLVEVLGAVPNRARAKRRSRRTTRGVSRPPTAKPDIRRGLCV